MKKIILIPTVLLLCLIFLASLSEWAAARELAREQNNVIRLHVRAADDSTEEQELKLKVRNRILTEAQKILATCSDPILAKKLLTEHLPLLEAAGRETLKEEGSNHDLSVSLRREEFEYREYEGFFLPEGEYESLIVTIGEGEGKNWWCVVFPAACYIGAAEQIETQETRMPECFRLANKKAEDVEVKWGLWEWIKSWF
ncbi:MAG: stage II sporulation protein R [Clostridia bacterium]|nr:stage II sporulation protein R [Clostridia bacterium]